MTIVSSPLKASSPINWAETEVEKPIARPRAVPKNDKPIVNSRRWNQKRCGASIRHDLGIYINVARHDVQGIAHRPTRGRIANTRFLNATLVRNILISAFVPRSWTSNNQKAYKRRCAIRPIASSLPETLKPHTLQGAHARKCPARASRKPLQC